MQLTGNYSVEKFKTQSLNVALEKKYKEPFFGGLGKNAHAQCHKELYLSLIASGLRVFLSGKRGVHDLGCHLGRAVWGEWQSE